MANFPTSLDNLTNVQDGVDYPKASHINNLNDAVEALEAKVGIDDSAVATSLDYIIKNNIYPIGSVYIAVVSTDPNTLLGFGTWSRIAEGRMLIGQKDSDADFNEAEETGGAKTHTLTTAELPSHSHGAGTLKGQVKQTSNGGYGDTATMADSNTGTSAGQNISGSTATAGSGDAHSIMNPYFTAYIWKRTA
jgi:hypothetical protein